IATLSVYDAGTRDRPAALSRAGARLARTHARDIRPSADVLLPHSYLVHPPRGDGSLARPHGDRDPTTLRQRSHRAAGDASRLPVATVAAVRSMGFMHCASLSCLPLVRRTEGAARSRLAPLPLTVPKGDWSCLLVAFRLVRICNSSNVSRKNC